MSGAKSQQAFHSIDELQRIQKKDLQTMTELVNKYTHELYNASLGLGFQEHDSKDLVQNVWLTIFERIGSFEGRSHIRTFIFGVLYNKALELRRQSSRIESTEEIDRVIDSRFGEDGHWIRPPMDPEAFALGAEKAGVLKNCLEGLSVNQRMAFVMKEVHGEESDQICEMLSTSISNLGVLLYRARNILRECIEAKLGARSPQGVKR